MALLDEVMVAVETGELSPIVVGDLYCTVIEGCQEVFDLLATRPYTQVQSYLDDSEPAGLHHYWKTGLLAGLDDGLLAGARELFAGWPDPGRRDRDPPPGRRPQRACRRRRRRRQPRRPRRRRVKGMWSPQDPDGERFRAAYGANYDRLVEVKRRWDPDNLFCANRNVAPG